MIKTYKREVSLSRNCHTSTYKNVIYLCSNMYVQNVSIMQCRSLIYDISLHMDEAIYYLFKNILWSGKNNQYPTTPLPLHEAYSV